MKLNFLVNENVLIPQPDTEILVEEVINIAKNLDRKGLTILDMCTGSGCIAISLSKYIKNADITGVDISYDALEVARKNEINNKFFSEINLEDIKSIKWIQSNLFENVNDKYEIIVSNPPYIKSNVIEALSQEVRNEPHIALDGGEDGLKFYKEIVKCAKHFLKTGGYLCLEIGFDQKEDVERLLKEEKYTEIYSKKDLAGNDRIVVARI